MNSTLIRCAAIVLLVCLPAAGQSEEKERFDRVDDATYRTVAGPVTVLVSVRLADLHRKQDVLALQVAVGTRSDAPPLLISRRSFSVSDSNSTIQPLLAREGFEPAHIIYEDRRFLRSVDLNDGNQFDRLRWIKTRFFPVGGEPGTRIVEMDPGTYIKDVLYFSQPEGGVDGDLVLHFVAAGLPEPIRTEFRLPPPPKKIEFWK